MLDKEKEKYLSKIYYDPSHLAAYGGVKVLKDFVDQDGRYKITKDDVRSFLEKQEIYSTHVSKKHAKSFYGMTSLGPNQVLDVDSAYFDFATGVNDYKHFIVLIDTFSKKLRAVPVRNLKAATVKNALMPLIRDMNGTRFLRHDAGTEYKNSTLAKALDQANIRSIVSQPPHKSSVSERAIKTIKSKLYKHMQKTGSKKWAEILPKVVESYNNRKHRSLLGGKLSPNEVEGDKIPKLWFYYKQQRMKHMRPPRKYKFQINDAVRVSKARLPFTKDFEEQNTTAVYFITYRYRSGSNVLRYRLKDEQNKPLSGSYTENQLQRTYVDENTEYRIEKIDHYATIGGQLHAFVVWAGLPARYNSYVLARNVVNLGDNNNNNNNNTVSGVRAGERQRRRRRKGRRR